MDYNGIPVSWSPDGKMLSYITSGPDSAVKGDCFVVEINTGAVRNVTPTPHPNFNNSWRAPLWNATGERIYLLSPDSIWKVIVKGNKTEETMKIERRIIEAVAPQGGGRLWSPDGGRSIIILTRDDQTKQEGFYRVDLNTRKFMKLLENSRSYGDFPITSMDVSSDGKHIVFIAEDAAHTPEIWLADVEFKNQQQVTHTNPKLDSYIMGTSRVLEWRGLNGENMRGALLLPANYQEKERYPLIVRVYPGYSFSDKANKFGINPAAAGVDNHQLFATHGYAVLMVDSSRPKGDPMRSIANSVLPGVTKMIDLGIADSERLGVIGHSNGGYGVLSLIVQTTRFKAAVASGGSGNLIGHYGFMRRDGESWGVAYQEESLGMGGPPWQFPNKYVENSPVFYLDRVQTPLLIVYGAEDSVNPSYLGDEIFVGLRRLGKEVEYAKYEGEGHWEGRWSYSNQVDYLNRVISWFDRCLKAASTTSKTPAQ
jgi:dipeptidyl aminopeptidase/acylaminoacyl peptidase